MKRWMSLLALLLLLTGCSTPGDPETAQTQAAPEEKPVTAFDLPAGEYSRLEVMGNDLLLVGETELVLLSGDSHEIKASTGLEFLAQTGENDLQVGDQGIACYERAERTIHFLDGSLQRIGSIVLSDEILGAVQLSRDWTTLYYCTAGGIYARDLEIGISRALTHMEGAWLGITGSFLDEAVLQCKLRQDDETVTTVMISAQTGEILRSSDTVDTWCSDGELYFCSLETEAGAEWIYGWGSEQPRNFWPAEDVQVTALPRGGVVLTCDGSKLNCFDLETGRRIAANTPAVPPEMDKCVWLSGCVYYLNGTRLYRWDPELSPVYDDDIYMSYRYTAEDPDEEGLEQYAGKAGQLGEDYGVNILMWNDVSAAQPADYRFTAEYIPENYEAAFAALTAALSHFDRDFFTTAGAWTESGRLNILLVRQVSTDNPAVHALENGMYYLLGGDAYIVLAVGGNVEQSFYHSLGHILDIVVMSNSKALYEWDDLNPKDFAYDGDYEANLDRDGSKYLKDGKEYFVDTFSMSYPVEDRATIFEYAIRPGNEAFFASKYMQKKLQTLCQGIREAFALPDGDYTWEQYINE